MAAHRWIVVLAALALAACASRVEPRLDAGLGAGWKDGPQVGGHLGLGKFEGTLAAPPLAGPVPPLSDAAPSSPLLPPPAHAAEDRQAGQGSCEGGACLIPGPTSAPAPAPAGDGGGLPLGAWIGIGLAFLLVAGLAFLGRPKAVKS